MPPPPPTALTHAFAAVVVVSGLVLIGDLAIGLLRITGLWPW